MFLLSGLPGLSDTRPKLKGYSVGLFAMYTIHTVGRAVSQPCYIPSTGKPSNHAGLIYVCVLSTEPITT